MKKGQDHPERMTDPTPSSIPLPGVKAPSPGKAIRVQAGSIPVAIFNHDGRLYAIGARCTHVGGPLERGPVEGNIVTCPLHGSQFNIDTGAVVRGPAHTPEPAYRVRQEGDGLVLDPV